MYCIFFFNFFYFYSTSFLIHVLSVHRMLARREMPRWRYVLNGAKMWITNGTVDGKETGDAYLVRRRGYGRDSSHHRTMLHVHIHNIYIYRYIYI